MAGLYLPRSHLIPVVGDDGSRILHSEQMGVGTAYHGVGGRRTMRAFGSSFEETVLAWNVNEEFAFRVDVCSFPAVRGLAERWRMRAVGSGSTELTWSLAVDSPGPLPVMRAFYLLVTRVMMGVAARRLATFVGADGDAPRQ